MKKVDLILFGSEIQIYIILFLFLGSSHCYINRWIYWYIVFKKLDLTKKYEFFSSEIHRNWLPRCYFHWTLSIRDIHMSQWVSQEAFLSPPIPVNIQERMYPENILERYFQLYLHCIEIYDRHVIEWKIGTLLCHRKISW